MVKTIVILMSRLQNGRLATEQRSPKKSLQKLVTGGGGGGGGRCKDQEGGAGAVGSRSRHREREEGAGWSRGLLPPARSGLSKAQSVPCFSSLEERDVQVGLRRLTR